MSQIVTSHYFIPSVLTAVTAYYGGLHILNTLYDFVTSYFSPQVAQQVLADYQMVLASWVVALQENSGLFRNTTSPFAIFTLYIVSLQLTNLQYIAYISLYLLVRTTYYIITSGFSLSTRIQNTVQYFIAPPTYSDYALTYYVPKEYPTDFTTIAIFLTILSLMYATARMLTKENQIEKKEKVITKHSMTLRSSKKRAALMLTDHSLS